MTKYDALKIIFKSFLEESVKKLEKVELNGKDLRNVWEVQGAMKASLAMLSDGGQFDHICELKEKL